MPAYYSITTLLCLIQFLTLILTTTTTPTPQSALLVHNKQPVQIQFQFSQDSDITIIITSCNRLKQLQATLNSFFHWNTYVLKELIIVEDCGASVSDIWQLLPLGANAYDGKFFRIIQTGDGRKAQNGKRKGFLGQIAAIDKAYTYVTTKYVFHLEEDWLQLGSYGFLERLKDVLEDCQKKQVKASQAILTFPSWSWTHMPGQQQSTSTKTKYHILTSYGKQYLYQFSFNPHLLNFKKVYKQLLNGSYMQSIARRFHCINIDGRNEMQNDGQAETVMENGGCVQYQTGKFLTSLGYKQVWVKIRKQPVYQHIGIEGWVGKAVQNYQWFGMNNLPNKQTSKQTIQSQLKNALSEPSLPSSIFSISPPSSPATSTSTSTSVSTSTTTASASTTTQTKKVSPQLKSQYRQEVQLMLQIVGIVIISLIMFGVFQCYTRCFNKVEKREGSRSNLKNKKFGKHKNQGKIKSAHMNGLGHSEEEEAELEV